MYSASIVNTFVNMKPASGLLEIMAVSTQTLHLDCRVFHPPCETNSESDFFQLNLQTATAAVKGFITDILTQKSQHSRIV